jgi:lipoprotein-anchoring transpeptidase ErfK/SrfK
VRRLAVIFALLALAAFAATAVAGTPAPRLTLTARGVNGKVGAVVSGATWTVSGTLRGGGRSVRLHVFRNGVRVINRRVVVRHGVYRAKLSVPGVGRVTVHALHGKLHAASLGIWVVAPQVAPDQRSYAARILQHELTAAHYVVGAPGVYDAQTQWAVMAFRKMAGLPRTFAADASVFAALAAHKGGFVILYPSQGQHVEADLTNQVMALIGANGVIQHLYAFSSGKPSTPTTPGNFHFYLRQPGVNNDGMVNSTYFNGGDAIHGYAEVPSYPASHGCLRVWIPDSLAIYDWVQLGMAIDVYYR